MPGQYSFDDKDDIYDTAREWIEQVLHIELPKDDAEFGEALKDGTILCNLLNAIKPNTVPQIRSGGAFFLRENVAAFIRGERSLGVPEADLFLVNDLFELKNFKQVCQSILALGRVSTRVSSFSGPYIVSGRLSITSTSSESRKSFIDTQTNAPKCVKCGKIVMFTERLNALGELYHKQCFTCHNCNTLLSSGDYVDHDHQPFCHNCYNKLFNKVNTPVQKTARFSFTPSEASSAFTQPSANPKCATCGKTVYYAERLDALGKVYHKNCFLCTKCHRLLGKGIELNQKDDELGEQLDHDNEPYCRGCYRQLNA